MSYLLVLFYVGLGGRSHTIQYEFKTQEECQRHGESWKKEVKFDYYYCLEIKK